MKSKYEIKRPPIGLMPRWLWQEKRLDEINAAIKRCNEAKKSINPEWIKEMDELEENRKNIK